MRARLLLLPSRESIVASDPGSCDQGVAMGTGRFNGGRRSLGAYAVVASALLAGLLTIGGLARAASTSTHRKRPRAYILTISGPIAGGGHVAEVKPRDIKLYSGAYLEHLRWSAWGASTARAAGDELDIDKTTSPYRGLTNPVKVRAYRLRRCGTKRLYRKLSVHFTGHIPPGLGLMRDSTYSMSCPD
jgi:hypothetical protein